MILNYRETKYSTSLIDFQEIIHPSGTICAPYIWGCKLEIGNVRRDEPGDWEGKLGR